MADAREKGEQQDLTGGTLRKSGLREALEKVRHELQDALDSASTWRKTTQRDLALEAVVGIAQALKKIRDVEGKLAKED